MTPQPIEKVQQTPKAEAQLPDAKPPCQTNQQFNIQGGKRTLHYYTSPQSLIFFFNNFGTCLYFDWLVHLVECVNVSTSNCNYSVGNFVYHYLGCTSGYRPLSYPF